ncbi:NUDIX hydrolase [Pseudomonas rubra]|uniref:Phosphatase NudJ n=1 Tax=Pseudomonas rubra TaxID=2942627 RepID=A0ABT5P1U3_9PSED|nr:NUDIX hydrolase [Pseudomonas rubra]MDD1012157.1 NUDIX hydrolase [Pseudomonas rubra]MDD1038407.1 NUDIX hydrolase [Pseudomonas rubra]MDD1153444.1 NUDIX hydrolase [Pseudomonas rubra]
MTWQPHITVATIIEDQGRFLLVEELKAGKHVLNQPAGHLEANETLPEAALRETLEETAWEVELTGVVGIYLYTAPSNGVTYQRVCFAARPLKHQPERALDSDIVRAVWLSREELLADPGRWRSELVPRCIDDYLAGPLYSLALIRD